jgi:hypothetical protein
METQELQEQEIQDLDTQEESETPQKNYRGKSSLKRLKDRLTILDKIAIDPKVKAAKQADVALEAASIEKLLFQTERDDKADKNLALNEQLTEQLTEANTDIARLTQANAALQSRTQVALPERIPDSVLQEQIHTLEALLQSVATLARGFDVDARTRHAVSLIVKHGKRAMSVVEEMGVSFSSVVTALQKSETELLGLLQQAQQEGTGTPIYRAVLTVKYEIQVDGHGKRQSPYRDEFDSESSLYADSL